MSPALMPYSIPLVFAGLRLREEWLGTTRLAEAWCRDAGEFVRPVVTAGDWRRGGDGPEECRWIVDFPPGASSGDVARAGSAGEAFVRARRRILSCGTGAELRIALAKVDRYLATPAAGRDLGWRWVPAHFLPAAGLVVVVRDDDFLASVLCSRWFSAWWRHMGNGKLVSVVRSFPLPWAATATRGSLTGAQDRCRDKMVAAWRAAGGGEWSTAGDAASDEALAAAVAEAYAWPTGIDEAEAIARLAAMVR